MACPFGVIRYHQDHAAPMGNTVAIKCDNCLERQEQGLIPACAEVCKSGALMFESPEDALKRKTGEVARSISADAIRKTFAPGFALLNSVKRAEVGIKEEKSCTAI